jgi:plastocyanin
MWQDCSLVRRIVVLFLAVLWLHGGQVFAQASQLGLAPSPIRVDITIKARRFHPSPVSLPVGRQVMLVFHNQDVELHAFVPQQFLEHVPVHVDGSGATQFGEKGLERVLIPSEGREEIHFVPTAVGTFEYRCDLPGHQMIGRIVVEEQSADQRAMPRQSDSVQGKQ